MDINLPKSAYKNFAKKLKSLNNKGKKIGGHLEITEEESYYDMIMHSFTRRPYRRPMIKLTIEGTVPKVNGYELVCRIEHTAAGNILTTISGSVEGWRDAKPYCQHCNSKRYRRDTFFVRHIETGELKQVGRSCLADYVRSDSIMAIVSWFHGFEKLGTKEYVSDPSWYEPETLSFLACACAAVRIDGGYFSRNSEKRPTVGFASMIYWPPSPSLSEDFKMEWRASQPTEADTQKARDILEWVPSTDDTQEYFHNLQTVCKLEGVSDRHRGILVSAIQAYRRARGESSKMIKKESAACASEYVGSIGGKIQNVRVSIEKIILFDSTYGTVRMILMQDENGNVFRWNASRKQDVEEGDAAMLCGTIKNHDEYRGTKQTIMTRCSFVKVA